MENEYEKIDPNRLPHLLNRTLNKLSHVSLMLVQNIHPSKVGLAEAKPPETPLEMSVGIPREGGATGSEQEQRKKKNQLCRAYEKELESFGASASELSSERNPRVSGVVELFNDRIEEAQLLNQLVMQRNSVPNQCFLPQIVHRDLKEAEFAECQATLKRLQLQIDQLEQECHALSVETSHSYAQHLDNQQTIAIKPSSETAPPPNWARFVMQSLILESGLNWAASDELTDIMTYEKPSSNHES